MNLLCRILAITLFASSAHAAVVHPGGANAALQYNNNGYFAGIAVVNGDCIVGVSGLWTAAPCSVGSGTVTSVAETMDGVIFNATVSGSPITGSGTLAPSLLTQTKNTLLAGPTTGSNAAPTFRTLVGADLPNPSASTLGGVQSLAAASHKWFNALSTSGVLAATQPACADLSDGATGCSTTVGALASLSTVGTSQITNSAVTYAKIQNEGAYSILGNNTSSAAAPAELGSIIIGTPGYTASGYNFGQLTASANSYAQLSLQNTNVGSSASSDFIVEQNDGTDTTHYANFGTNNSAGGASPFTTARAAYLYSTDSELDLGALGASGILNFYTTGGTGSPVKAGFFDATQLLNLTNALTGANGGTGVNNGTKTITLGGNLATSGANNVTFTTSGSTNVTLPTSGTLSTTTGTVTSIATTSPITGGTIISTGTIACATCATTTNGGALSGTAPIAISAAGVISGGGLGSVTGALKGNGSGTITQAACTDLSNGATGCSTATGTSGATLPLLNGANTWSAVQSVNSGDLALKGATSGTITLNAAATAGSNTLTLPAGTTDFSGTGGTSQVVKQTSTGGAFTVARLACADLSNGATSCSTDATNATNISSGTLASARGGAGSITGALKGNGSGVVSQAACSDLSNGATGCSTATGTSGATIPLLNGANTWSGVQTLNKAIISAPSVPAISTSTFAVDASLSNTFRVVLVHASCPCTISNPTNAVDGEKIIIEMVQSATGSDTIGTWGTNFSFGTAGTPTLTTSANKIDLLGFQYSTQNSKWNYLGIQQGM